MTERTRTHERDAQVVAAAPQLAEEQCFQRSGIAEVNTAQLRLGDDPVAGQPKTIAEIDVLTRGERRIESADALECGALDGEVAAAKPVDVFPRDRPRAQPVILLLHP